MRPCYVYPENCEHKPEYGVKAIFYEWIIESMGTYAFVEFHHNARLVVHSEQIEFADKEKVWNELWEGLERII